VSCKREAPSGETVDAIELEPTIAVDIGHFSFGSRADIELDALTQVAGTGEDTRSTTDNTPLLDPGSVLIWSNMTKFDRICIGESVPWR